MAAAQLPAAARRRPGDGDDGSRAPSPSPSQLPPVPASPVYSLASTAALAVSHFNLPPPPPPPPAHAVLRKADLEHSQEAYAHLVASAKAYRLALASLSTAASAFASALEACARLKEARAEPIGPGSRAAACTADPLLAASGVHHLVANHQQILSDTVYRAFEVPLLHDLDRWRSVIDDEDQTYQHRIRAQARELRRLEKDGLKLHRQPRRHVARFRAHLVDLTSKLDGLTTLHADDARTLLRESQDTSARIVDASCSLVRAEVDIFESLARKGWTGGGLDDLLERGRDLFATDDAAAAAAAPANPAGPAKLFSILPPRSILADSASDASRLDHDRADGLLPATAADAASADDDVDDDLNGIASLTASAAASNAGTSAADSPSSASSAGTVTAVVAPSPSKSRPPRPFSPQPIRRIPTDVTFESLGALASIDATGLARRQPRADDEADKELHDTISTNMADGRGLDAPKSPHPEPELEPEPFAGDPWQNRGRQPSHYPYRDRRSSSPGLPATHEAEADGN